MQTKLRLKTIRLNAEFLNRIRKRNREVDVAERVIIVATVQQIVDASTGLAARYGERSGGAFEP